jgi:hypothetical protein
MTVKCGIDMWQCFWLDITNTTDYILFVKTAVFVLPIVQCTNTRCGLNADTLHIRYI